MLDSENQYEDQIYKTITSNQNAVYNTNMSGKKDLSNNPSVRSKGVLRKSNTNTQSQKIITPIDLHQSFLVQGVTHQSIVDHQKSFSLTNITDANAGSASTYIIDKAVK